MKTQYSVTVSRGHGFVACKRFDTFDDAVSWVAVNVKNYVDAKPVQTLKISRVKGK